MALCPRLIGPTLDDQGSKRAEVLIAFQHARDALRAELDIEPGRELRDIAQRLRSGTAPDPAASPASEPVQSC